MLPTINTSCCFAKWEIKWLKYFDCCHVYPHASLEDDISLMDFDSFHINALPPRFWEAVVRRAGSRSLCSLVLLQLICSGFIFTHKREVSSMPSPSPLLNPWPDYVAQLPELQWQIEKNTCRSRKQITCFVFVFLFFFLIMILLLFGNATTHKVGVSLESFEICLSSVVFAEAVDQPVQAL